MLRVRVIPVLLLDGEGLVKTVKFSDPKYVGDPINAVRIFNEKEVDELIFLDIAAAKKSVQPNFALLEHIAGECFMPLGYGGGVTSLEDARRLLAIGIEKVVVNTANLTSMSLITQVSNLFGAQAVVGAIDVKRTMFGGYKVFDHRRSKTTDIDAVAHAQRLEQAGAGEIFLNSVDRDGTQEGYLVELISSVSSVLTLPLVVCGGAGQLEHFRKAVDEGGASAVAAGSMFVFHGKHRAVLITYPGEGEVRRVLEGRG